MTQFRSFAALKALTAGLALMIGLFAADLAMAKGGGDACDAIKLACENAGFSRAGTDKGTKLSKDCMVPLLNGQAASGKGKLALPVIDADTIAACAAEGGVKGKGGKLARTAGAPADGAGPLAAKALPAGTTGGPNIVMILADDFAMNLLSTDQGVLAQSMPNVAQMMRDGASFTHYFVTDSLCCPSRTSIFTGMLPHNSGVYTNVAPSGGFAGFMAHGDDGKTFALTLRDRFYETAMMGKYLNGYQTGTDGVPQGWSEWAVASNGYPNFNYELNENGALTRYPAHLTDQLSVLGQAYIKRVAEGPFFLELATFSPHAPYTPPARYADAFAGVTAPQTPAFGADPDANAPDWLQSIPPLDRKTIARLDEIYRKRVQSDKGIDDMVHDIRALLDQLGLAETTYVIFTSDNGFHLGEFNLRPGKMTPFDLDIHVPLVIVGPGIKPGTVIDQTAMNIDLYPTFVELAGGAASANVDGRSLVPLLRGQGGDWRNLAVVEHQQVGENPDDPDSVSPKAGDPPTYVALRLPDAMYVEYDNAAKEVGYYDMTSDPYQLHNIAGTLPKARLDALHQALVANHACKGAVACDAAQDLRP